MASDPSEHLLTVVQEIGSLAMLGLFACVAGALWQARAKLMKRPALLHAVGLAIVCFGYWLSRFNFGETGSMVASAGIFGLGVALLAASFTLQPPPKKAPSPPGDLERLAESLIIQLRQEIEEIESRPMAPLHKKLKLEESRERLSTAIHLWIEESKARRREDNA